MGIGDPSTYKRSNSSSFVSRATTYITWVAIALILATSLINMRRDMLYYNAAGATSVSGLTQLESKVAADLRHAIAPNQLVVTDAQFVAGLADRNTPPALVDTSAVRINSGYLTLSQLENATAQSQVHAVLFFTGRFYLPHIAAFHAWVAQNFHLLHEYGGGRELWVR